MAFAPASEAPITAPRLAISSSIWMNFPAHLGQLAGHYLRDLGGGRDRVPGVESDAGRQRAEGDRLVARQ